MPHGLAFPRATRRATASHATAGVGPSPLAGGSFRTGDLAEIDADGFIRVHGRRD